MYPVKSDHLFVYSSLLQGFATADYHYVSQYFDFVGPAKTRGKLSILDQMVVGTPTDEEMYIQGELYKIKEQDLYSFAIGQLDEYEGINPEEDEHPRYRRDITTVYLDDGTEVRSWVYWYNLPVENLPVIASGDVMDFLNQHR